MRIKFGIENQVLYYKGDNPQTMAEAFDVSIAKWKFLEKYPVYLHEGGFTTCGLCMVYYNNGSCDGCPVAIETGDIQCDRNSHYLAYCENEKGVGNSGIAAKEEVAFLKKLKKKYCPDASQPKSG